MIIKKKITTVTNLQYISLTPETNKTTYKTDLYFYLISNIINMVDFYTLKMKQVYQENYKQHPKTHLQALNYLKIHFDNLMKPYLAQETHEKWITALMDELPIKPINLATHLASLEKSELNLIEMKSSLEPLASAINKGLNYILLIRLLK